MIRLLFMALAVTASLSLLVAQISSKKSKPLMKTGPVLVTLSITIDGLEGDALDGDGQQGKKNDIYVPKTDKDHLVTCVVTNSSAQDIFYKPIWGYGGFSLMGKGMGHGWWSRLHRLGFKDVKQPPVIIKAGTEKVVFKMTLDELFFGKRQADGKWSKAVSWDWMAHPKPPESPLTPVKKRGYVPSFQMKFQLTADGKLYESDTVEVRVGKAHK